MLCCKLMTDKRIIGLDYGSVTVGVAMTDALGITAQPLTTIFRSKENHLRQTLAEIERLVTAYDVGLIVLGKPVHLDGSEGERVRLTEAFGDKLAARIPDIPIVFQDERLTTAEADEILEEMEIPVSRRKEKIDSIAAAIILRDYMNMREKNGQ